MTAILGSDCREAYASKLQEGKQMQMKRGDLSLKTFRAAQAKAISWIQSARLLGSNSDSERLLCLGKFLLKLW